MGYKAGKGLGKEDGGITKPIEDSAHKGRRGLGFSLEGLEKDEVDWKPEEVNPGFAHPSNSIVVWCSDCHISCIYVD